MNKSLLILLISLCILLSGCSNRTKKDTGSGTAGKKSGNNLSTSNTISGESPPNSTDIIGEIVQKDIFTPPDMRSANIVSTRTEDEEIIEPQKLTITGIVYDGTQYLVSVENSDTNEFQYLKKNDLLVNDPIISINFDRIEVTKAKKTIAYTVGDSIPLPGTRSQSSRSGFSSEGSSDIAETETGISDSSPIPLPPAGDSIEEMLRKRRQQQEEELK